MKELWIQATEFYNLPLTIGLICFCAYWLISSIGLFDLDTDVDIEVDTEIDVGGAGGIFSSILNFVNAADVPVMLILTLLDAAMWAISMIANGLWNTAGSAGIALGLLLPNFIISVIIVRYLSKPLAPLFNAIKNDVEAAEPLIGQVGKVKSRVLDSNYGQVEVARYHTAPALVNCMLRESDKPMVRGEEVLLISHDKAAKKYVVRSLSAEDDPLVISKSVTLDGDSEDNQETTQNENLTIKNE